MKYGKMLFGTESSECGFEIKLIAYETIEKCDFTITNNGNCSLDTWLQREKLYLNFLQKKTWSENRKRYVV